MGRFFKGQIPQAWFVALVLSFMGSVSGSSEPLLFGTPALNLLPDQGGQGTVFNVTIENGSFGSTKGVVLVGKRPCAIVSWSESVIKARINWDINPGTFDVTVVPPPSGPAWSESFVIKKGFRVVIPHIDSSGPVNVIPGDEYEVAAINLPPEQGEAFLQVGTTGLLIRCSVKSWKPETVRIEIPEAAPGTYNLILRTSEGDVDQNGLFNIRSLEAPGVDWDYVWKGYFNVSATAIMYGGKICRFLSGYDDTAGIRYDISNHPRDAGNRGQIVDEEGTGPSSNDQAVPVIIGERLYVFWTIREGGAFEYTWTENVEIPNPKWAKLTRVPANVRGGNRPNVLYHVPTKSTYIYYREANASGSVNVLRWHDKSTTWENFPVRILNYPDNWGIRTTSDVSAAVNSRGEVMLATEVNGKTYVGRSKDPLRTSHENSVVIEGVVGSPGIRGLGQGQVALLWQDGDHYVNIMLYSDERDSWGDRRRTGSQTYRSPTAMPVFSKYTNDPQKGQGLELRLWYFFFDHENSYGREERYLGELRQTEEKKTDWNMATSELGLPPSEEDATRLELIKSCPLVGIVDVPPPAALNGKPAGDNKSNFTFTHVDQSTNSVKIDWKAGIFVSTLSNAPVCLDEHVGVQGAFSESVSTRSRVSYIYKPNYDAGKVSAIHAVPVTLARKFETFRDNKKIEGVAPIVVLQVVDTSLLQIPVDPSSDKRMITHKAGDLESYKPTAGGYKLDSKSATWMGNAAATVEFGDTTTTSTMLGTYATLKAGGQVPGIVSFGIEGQFSLQVINETSTSRNWALTLDNPEPTQTGHVKGFLATLMRLHPTKEQYWVPEYVKDGKDAAWFLTYNIDEIEYK